MKPAASIIIFTTVAGAAQGMTVAVAVATIAGRSTADVLALLLWTATAMLIVALVASFFHLGHPLRAWRAVLMWRTSWMSREVIALPAFIGIVGAWASLLAAGALRQEVNVAFAWVSIAGSLVLWVCTAMIYACIRFIQEWAHPLTIANYFLIGMSSGLVATGAVAAWNGHPELATGVAPWAIAATLAAWFSRAVSLRRNDRIRPRSTVQSATGIRASRVVQKSMGMTGGSFNTREFFHGAPTQVFKAARVAFQVMAFALPLLLLAWAMATGSVVAWLAATASQATGVMVERWYFFAQATHPQNIYYQAVS